MLFLAMYGDKLNFSETFFISAFSMIIVFFVLLVISYLIDFAALIINNKNTKIKENDVIVKAAKDIDNSNENVVVIAAAIAAYLGTTMDNIKIKSIRRINQNNSAWAEKGLLSQVK